MIQDNELDNLKSYVTKGRDYYIQKYRYLV